MNMMKKNVYGECERARDEWIDAEVHMLLYKVVGI